VTRSWATLRLLLLIGAGTCLLLWSALANGYPIVFDDTGAYV
jgi:hypothetical protein